MYDLLVTNRDTVETSVQEYWDNTIGRDRTRFELYTVDNAAIMSFHREFDYSSYSVGLMKDIVDADAFIMTAHEHEDFMIPVPFPALLVPGFGYPYRASRTDSLNVYRRGAEILGVSKIKNASLDISPIPVILRVQIE